MSDKIVLVLKKGHANLDSFPFRYGFTQVKDFNLIIQYDSKPIVQSQDSKKGNNLRINDASFLNPINKNERLHGTFVIKEKSRRVVTVIRKDNGVEKSLSKALRVFRKYEYVQVSELIDYFHPLYMNGDIKTHQDFKKYWIDKNSDDPKIIAEMESDLANVYKELDKEQAAHEETKKKLKKEQAEHEKQKKLTDQERKRAEELERKIKELESKATQSDTYENGRVIDEWNPGKFKLVYAYWGHQGVKSQNAVILLLCGEDGIGFTVANNWEKGLQERFELAQLLTGRNIRYSTWRKDLYSKKWFKNIRIPHVEKGKASEFELKDIYIKTEIPNNGLHIEYYDNTHKMIEVNYKDGKLDGKWSWWYDNGRLNVEKNYKNGKLDGMMTTWLYYGEKESERNYVDGELDGDVTWWNSPIN